MKTKALSVILIACVVLGSGCGLFDQTVGGIVGSSDTATVMAKTAQIRTSYAVVAADLLEVKRGDKLDVIDQIDFEKVQWLRVRAHDETQTEGWIEAQNVITNDVLERSKKLAEGFKDLQPQAAGQLRAASNLRLAADMNPDNALFKMPNGASFEVMDWEYVPKQEVPDVDDAAKGEKKSTKKAKNEEIEAAKEAGDAEKLDDKYDIWYLVKLDPSVSPAPAGWLFGRQVELQVPTDIVFFQTNNRKFVSWQRLDTDSAAKAVTSDRNATPGDWIVLSRTNAVKAIDGVEADFDAVQIFAFNKYDQSYYTAYRTTTDLWGVLPLRVEGVGDNKTFSLKLRNANGQMEDKRFVVFRDKSRLKVTPPEDIAQYLQAKGR
ncbi:MAG: hypothetical protein ACR2IH_06765 [Pyrinomonadaceae bacterium]